MIEKCSFIREVCKNNGRKNIPILEKMADTIRIINKSDLLSTLTAKLMLRVKIVPRIMWLRLFMDQNDIKNDDA